MSSQELKDPFGKLLGRIQQSGGKFDPNANETRDAFGKLVGRGNLLTTLL